MKSFSVLIVIAFCLYTYGCATSSKTYTADGKEGYTINCSGTARNWGMCYEEAGQLCGGKGYIVLQKTGDKGNMIVANQYGLYGGSVTKRNLVIRCKDIEPGQSQTTALGHGLTPAQVFEKVKHSVVVVKTFDNQEKMMRFGSGVLLPSGKIATNCHVIKDGVAFQVGGSKQFVIATLYAGDADKDICILAAPDFVGEPVQLGKAENLRVGEPVYAVGTPQGFELSLSDGIVAQLRGVSPPIIQTTVPISPGSSGGGLFNGEGRLVGITTSYVEGGQSLNFAMPVEWIGEVQPGRKPVAKGIGQTGSIGRP